MTEVGKPNSLTKRVGSNAYYFRRRYPAELALRIGKAEFVRSLRTGIYADALKMLPEAEGAYLDQLRAYAEQVTSGNGSGIMPTALHPTRSFNPSSPELTLEAVTQLAQLHYRQAKLKLDHENLTSRDLDGLEEVEAELATLADSKHPNACRWAEAEEIKLLSEHRLRTDPTSEASRLMREYLRRSLVQIARLRHARMRGDYLDVISDAMFRDGLSASPAPIPVPHSGGITFNQLIELYDAEHIESDDLSVKTERKNRAALSIIARYFGPDTEVLRINREDCFGFRDALGKLPPNFTKKFGDEVDLQEIATSISDGPFLDRQTQQHYLRTLARLLAHACDRRMIAANPAEGLKPRGKSRRKEAARNAYSTAQLKTIFSAPLYTGCKDDGAGFAQRGPNVPRRSRFWLPLIALFTGLRMGEILQLTANHVHLDANGLPFIFITPDMKVKNENAYRRVPVHDELLKIGFLKLVAEAASRSDKLLFPDVPNGSDGYQSSIFSKRYATFCRSLDLNEPGRKVVFHSFRHTFRDALRVPNANTDLVEELGGWSRGAKTSSSYGDGASAEVLRPLIESIVYGLDLSHLYAW